MSSDDIKRIEVTPDLIREFLSYDATSNKYFWSARSPERFKTLDQCKRWNRQFAGKQTLITKNGNGYDSVQILGKRLYAHRVVWAFHHGKWPDGEIDHINRDRADNRIENLRDVSGSENRKNTGPRLKNISQIVGVTFHKPSKKWLARIYDTNGQRVYLGVFSTTKEAAFARQQAEIKYKYPTAVKDIEHG